MKVIPPLVVLATAIMIAVPVAAVEHHENYDTAERNIDLIIYYIDRILEELNDVLESMHSRNVSSVELHSLNFTDMIGRAGKTLESIPAEVDSYAELSRDLEDLNRTDEKLSDLLEAYTDLEYAVAVFENYVFDFSDARSFIENITAISNSLESFDAAISQYPTSSSELYAELEILKWKGFDIDRQLILAGDLSIIRTDLQDERISEDDILNDVMSHPMGQWSGYLSGLLDESVPNSTLSADVLLLDISSHQVKADLAGPIGRGSADLGIIDEALKGFHENQTRFLDLIGTLKSEGADINLSMEMEMISLAEIALDHMFNHHDKQLSRYNDLSSYDDGSVMMKLSALTSLLAHYMDVWIDLDIRMSMFRNLAHLTEELILSNVLSVDPDDSGKIDFHEINSITLNSTSSDLADRISEINDEIQTELDLIEEDIRYELQIIYRPLKRISSLMVDFTRSHESFVESIQLIDYNATDLASYIFSYIQAFGDLLSMMRNVETASPLIHDTENGSIRIDESGIISLESNVALYSSLMEEIGFLFNRSFLAVHLDSTDAPYDSFVNITSMIFHPDEGNGIGFRNDEHISITTDWGLMLDLITIDGMARGMITIPRNITIGAHNINGSSTTSANETLYHNISIIVRRIRTETEISPDRNSIDMGESLNLTIEIRDEYGRPVDGNVSLNGVDMFVTGSIVYIYQPVSFGDNPIIASYPGDAVYMPSVNDIILNVSLDPVISMLFNGTDFYIGEDINGSIHIGYGQGNILLLRNGIPILEIFLRSGDTFNFTLNSTEMGIGSFRMTAEMGSTVPWSRSGQSGHVFIRILEMPVPPIVDEETDPVEEIDPPATGDGGDDPGGYDLGWQIAAVSLLVLIFGGALTIALIWTRRNTRKIEADAPVHRKVVKTQDQEEEDTDMKPIRKVVIKPTIPPANPAIPVDPSRAAIINQYLDLIDGAPTDLRIDRTKTPREVGHAMIGKGADSESVRGVTSRFESAIYSGVEPSGEQVKTYGIRIGNLRDWFRSRSGMIR